MGSRDEPMAHHEAVPGRRGLNARAATCSTTRGADTPVTSQRAVAVRHGPANHGGARTPLSSTSERRARTSPTSAAAAPPALLTRRPRGSCWRARPWTGEASEGPGGHAGPPRRPAEVPGRVDTLQGDARSPRSACLRSRVRWRSALSAHRSAQQRWPNGPAAVAAAPWAAIDQEPPRGRRHRPTEVTSGVRTTRTRAVEPPSSSTGAGSCEEQVGRRGVDGRGSRRVPAPAARQPWTQEGPAPVTGAGPSCHAEDQ